MELWQGLALQQSRWREISLLETINLDHEKQRSALDKAWGNQGLVLVSDPPKSRWRTSYLKRCHLSHKKTLSRKLKILSLSSLALLFFTVLALPFITLLVHPCPSTRQTLCLSTGWSRSMTRSRSATNRLKLWSKGVCEVGPPNQLQLSIMIAFLLSIQSYAPFKISNASGEGILLSITIFPSGLPVAQLTKVTPCCPTRPLERPARWRGLRWIPGLLVQNGGEVWNSLGMNSLKALK